MSLAAMLVAAPCAGAASTPPSAEKLLATAVSVPPSPNPSPGALAGATGGGVAAAEAAAPVGSAVPAPLRATLPTAPSQPGSQTQAADPRPSGSSAVAPGLQATLSAPDGAVGSSYGRSRRAHPTRTPAAAAPGPGLRRAGELTLARQPAARAAGTHRARRARRAGAPLPTQKRSATARSPLQRLVRDIQRIVPGWVWGLVGVSALLNLALMGHGAVSRRRLAASRHRAATDALTGLPNRRFLYESLGHSVAASARSGAPMGVVLFDLDHFKDINDRFGHQTGDQALRVVARIARDQLRSSDIVGRFGGEEFLVLLPDTDQAGVDIAAEHLRRAIAAAPVEGLDRPVTASFGTAVAPHDGDSLERLLAGADLALYASKQAGRNRATSSRERQHELMPALA